MNILFLSILFPLIGFVMLAVSRGQLKENLSATIAIWTVGLSAIVTVYAGIDFFKKDCQSFSIPLWTWVSVGNFKIEFNLILDGLSLRMLSVVTGVGFLIHIFACWYMRGEEGYSRFFAYTNLFIASMLILVLGDNLLLMYLGWEGVGLCSYLLIGFYYTDLKNSTAAMKAFIITRVGDVFLAVALFIFYNQLGTVNFTEMVKVASVCFEGNNTMTMLWWATIMLLIGAIGKSAQLPLQTWLADAMVGPTPVSALIHAATMVTAGVYLIARTNGLFMMNLEILHLVGILGTITLLLASFAALVQSDIKRILAYSTMSQIGYMFLALGVQAWNAAIFHLMTHAFFKALLFLSSGSLILSCQHEQNIFKMGGLRKSIPLIYICFLAGGASLSALPLVTAGYFSKEKILLGAMENGNINLMIAGLIGAFMTSLYTFRMIYLVFHGKKQIEIHAGKGITHHLPLIILLILSTFIGALIIPPLQGVVPDSTDSHILKLEIASSVVAISGILVAKWLWMDKRTLLISISKNSLVRLLKNCWYNALGFDHLYNWIFVKPFLGIAWLLKHDPLNALMNIPAILLRIAGMGLLFSETGYLRWYIASMNIGAIFLILLLILLR